jgi:hypothetical protein
MFQKIKNRGISGTRFGKRKKIHRKRGQKRHKST